MNKQTLRSILGNMTEGKVFTINFRSSHANTSGDYVFIGSRTGRGKGGSILAELSLVGQEDVVVVGTKDSDDIVNVVVDGVVHGLENENQLIVKYETDSTKFLELKREFKTFLQDNVCPQQVRITSSVERLNGVHTIVGAKQLRGRIGQVQLETSEGLKVCSYNHSGVIQEVELLDD